MDHDPAACRAWPDGHNGGAAFRTVPTRRDSLPSAALRRYHATEAGPSPSASSSSPTPVLPGTGGRGPAPRAAAKPRRGAPSASPKQVPTEANLRELVEAQQAAIRQLSQASKAFRLEVAALRDCLVDSGVLNNTKYLIQVHKRRFEEVRALHPTGGSEACIEYALQSSGTALAVAAYAGLAAASALHTTSQDIKVTGDATFAIGRMFPAKLYVCGGFDGAQYLSSVERFDPSEGTWETMPPMSIRRYAPAAAVVLGQLYVCGGFDSANRLSSAERFDPPTGAWEALPPMSTQRAGLAAGVIAGQLYVCGGTNGSRDLNTMERFDPARAAWEVQPAMSTPRYMGAAAVILGQLYVTGGSAQVQRLSSAERFDPRAGTWEELPCMSTRRYMHAAATIVRQLYVVGGSDGAQCLECMERFDPAAGDIWEDLAQMSVRRERLAAAVLAGRLYVFGGFNGVDRLSSMERFDPILGEWQEMEPMSTTRVWLAGAVVTGSSTSALTLRHQAMPAATGQQAARDG